MRRSSFTAVVAASVMAAAPLVLAAPAAHAAVVNYAEVQFAFYDAAGRQVGSDDVTLLGTGASAPVHVPDGAVLVEVTNDPFPLSDATVGIVAGSATGRSAALEETSVDVGYRLKIVAIGITLLETVIEG